MCKKCTKPSCRCRKEICRRGPSCDPCCPRRCRPCRPEPCRPDPCRIFTDPCCDPCRPDPPCYSQTQFTSGIAGFSNLINVIFTLVQFGSNYTLSWAPFSGQIATADLTNLTVVQPIRNPPAISTSSPIVMTYNGVSRVTYATLGADLQLKIFLNADGSGTGVAVNDAVMIQGGTMSWTGRS